MSLRFHPDAEAELSEAIQYYENVESGLGQDFAVEAYSAIQRAIAYPHAWMVLEGEVRRALVRRFPYGVLYSEESDGILIIAVMHLHRAPGYWSERV
ncbi:MAG: type II toxin-antitoxin system RelE/ParE family toxin [Gammaproteobacteria bacterium]